MASQLFDPLRKRNCSTSFIRFSRYMFIEALWNNTMALRWMTWISCRMSFETHLLLSIQRRCEREVEHQTKPLVAADQSLCHFAAHETSKMDYTRTYAKPNVGYHVHEAGWWTIRLSVFVFRPSKKQKGWASFSHEQSTMYWGRWQWSINQHNRE